MSSHKPVSWLIVLLLPPTGIKDAAKCIQGRKRHILVDTLWLILAVVTAAHVPEREGAKLIFAIADRQLQKNTPYLGRREL
ncbi:MAG: hypothetical protein QX203_06245 [Methylococcaceae bacterium]